jgi:hypothetical protein
MTGVLGMEECVLDELPDVGVLDAVEDLRALPAGTHEPGHAQLRQML